MRKLIKDVVRQSGYEIVAGDEYRRLRHDREVLAAIGEHGLDVLGLVIRQVVSAVGRPFFVQVGANDGSRDDRFGEHVRRHGLEGLFVEPQPEAFARLSRLYADRPGLRFENAAIARETGHATMYGMDGFHGDMQLDIFTRFNKEELLRLRRYLGVSAEVREIVVPGLTFADLLSKHGVNRVDILVVDTEGFDFEILKMVDWSEVSPALVVYEIVNLKHPDKKDSVEFLADRGYRVVLDGKDVIATRIPMG